MSQVATEVATESAHRAHRAKQLYQNVQLQADNPLGLVVRVYDALLSALHRGAEHLEQEQIGEAVKPIHLATEIIGQLQATLDLERGGEVAKNLDALYFYCRKEVLQAHVTKSPTRLRGVAQLLSPLRDAWAAAKEKAE